MINLTADCDAAIRSIEHQLGDLAPKAPYVLAKAINATAKDARTSLAKGAQEAYTIKSGKFNKAMKLKNASSSKPTATITAKGTAMELMDFKVSPASVPTQDSRPDITKGKVLKSSKMKALQKGNLKAFVAKFRSGHVSVVQRRGPERLPLKKLLSPAIPQMIGNERDVYGKIRPDIQANLEANINAQIEKLLKGATA